MKIVISDTHFGIGRDAILTRKKSFSRFFEILSILDAMDPIDEIILLGDVFDFWVAKEEKAVRESRKFIEEISNYNTTYVIGNHDHHLTRIDAERWLKRKFGKNPFNKIVYPDYEFKYNKGKFFLTHGHHFGKEMQIIPKKGEDIYSSLQKDVLEEKDLIKPYEFFYNLGQDAPDVEELISGRWETIHEIINWIKEGRKGARTGALIRNEQVYVEKVIKEYLETREKKFPNYDYFIFGHTHDAWMFDKVYVHRGMNKRKIFANSGCWYSSSELVEFLRLNRYDVGTFLAIYEDGKIELRSLSGILNTKKRT